MLSKKQMRRLIQSVYGNSSEEGKEIERLYARASRQIKGEISQFVAGQANWSGKPSKAALEDVRMQLEALTLDGSISSMANVFLSSINLGHPKNSDLETARIAVPLLGVAQQRQRQLVGMGKRILDAVAKITHAQHQETPTMHQVPINYDRMLQRQASDSVTQRQQVSDAINRDIMDTVDKIRQIAKEAANSPKDNLNWADQVERVLTGGKKTGGASARAKMIIRTQACHELNQATIADFKARGVRQYRFLSLESINTCSRCSDMDYKVYEVADAQAGVNLPPMHPNCQCWIVEYGDEGYVSGSQIDKINSGSIRKDLSEDDRRKAETKHAENYYRELRGFKRKTVVSKITKSSGLDAKLVTKAVAHVLDSKYLLYDADRGEEVIQHFYPDYDMAQSFQRLYLGQPLPHDILMLKHEALEADYMDGPMKMMYDPAHRLTNQKYNYDAATKKWKRESRNEQSNI